MYKRQASNSLNVAQHVWWTSVMQASDSGTLSAIYQTERELNWLAE